jgi:hypothetical protein
MAPPFDKENINFEYLPTNPPSGIEKTQINGWAVLCTWPEEGYIGHSSFSFDVPASENIFAAKYHHQLIHQIDNEINKRTKRGEFPSGGAFLNIEQGSVYIHWISREDAELAQSSHHHAQAVEELRAEYSKVLDQSEVEALFSAHAELSGFFLPSPSPNYFKSHPRVFVVGQETRGWRNKACRIKNEFSIDDAEIDASMKVSQKFSSSGAKKSTFLQFYRKLSATIDSGSRDAALWSNQFCVSHNSGSPVSLPPEKFDIVKKLSYKLLRAQIDILKPSVIIFTTGPSRDKYIKECFPEYETVNIIEPRRLWHFKVGDVNCIRTSHPRWVEGTEYLDRAIQMVQELA